VINLKIAKTSKKQFKKNGQNFKFSAHSVGGFIFRYSLKIFGMLGYKAKTTHTTMSIRFKIHS
jgi:hypothetical protein